MLNIVYYKQNKHLSIKRHMNFNLKVTILVPLDDVSISTFIRRNINSALIVLIAFSKF